MRLRRRFGLFLIFTKIVLRYRGRVLTTADVEFLRELVARHPGESRRRLSVRVCEAWDWRQENGALKDMVCRGLMLALARAGHPGLRHLAARENCTAGSCRSWGRSGFLHGRLALALRESAFKLIERHANLGSHAPHAEHLRRRYNIVLVNIGQVTQGQLRIFPPVLYRDQQHVEHILLGSGARGGNSGCGSGHGDIPIALA
jgi:hypothetical protein